MRFNALFALVPLFVTNVLAIFQDEAYHIDFHYALFGLPKPDSTFFHRPQASSSASLLYTLSEKLVLGAVNPRDGSIVWRQDLSPFSSSTNSIGVLRAKAGENIVISAVGSHVSAWDASDGRLVWDTHFENEGEVKDLEIVDNASDSQTVLALLGGEHGITKLLNKETGQVRWSHRDESGDTPFQVSSSPSSLFSVSLHSTLLKGFKIKVNGLDANGKPTSQYTLNSDSDLTSSDSIIFVGANTAAPIIAWSDKGHKNLKINVIGSKNIQSIAVDNDTGEEIETIKIHAPRSPNALSHFLVHYTTTSRDWAEVYHIDLKSSSVSKAYSLPKLIGQGGTFSTSTVDANVYFTRITGSEVILVSSASHGLLGRWPITPREASADLAVSEVVARGKSDFAVRCALVSGGLWSLIRNGDEVWTRPEDLAGAVAATWIDDNGEGALKHELEVEGHGSVLEAYLHRVNRHARDLRHFPKWIQSLPQIITSSFSTSKAPASFGFDKVVLVGTDSGRVMAVDAGNDGMILWNHQVIADAKKTRIVIMVANGRLVDIHSDDGSIIQLDAVTGTVLRATDSGVVPSGFVNVPGNSTMIPVLEDGSVAPLSDIPRGVVVTLKNKERVLGWKIDDKPSLLWEFHAPPGHKFLSVVSRLPHDPVASIGKVLGDRSVMYKYLNPNLALATSVSSNTLSFHLLDAVSGQVLNVATYHNVDTTLPIPSVISENWFAYSFFADSKGASGAKGFQLVISELYESPVANDRGPLGSNMNFSSVNPSTLPKPHVLSQSYIIPEGISNMAVTQSRQGITTRQILCTLSSSHAILGIPKPYLDPRRPIDRDATASEVEEGLFKYNPVLEFDPKWYLTHVRDVAGIKDVVTIPSSLESTSLVFAFGHDIFGTRISPSGSFDVLGKGFSKIQLVITVLALGLGVAILAPMVRKKQVDARWKM